MEVTIDIDEGVYDIIQRMARNRHASPTELIAGCVANFAQAPTCERSVIGLFASEADLLDEVVEDAMRARERDPLRTV